jgi:hypothetical protein
LDRTEHHYHWYLTNLKVAPTVIYPLYRLKWQVELIFKGCKSSLNADRMTSRNPLIIQNLLLASLAGQLASAAILQFGRDRLPQDRRLAVSFQRTAKIAALLARDFVRCFLAHTSQATEALSR